MQLTTVASHEHSAGHSASIRQIAACRVRYSSDPTAPHRFNNVSYTPHNQLGTKLCRYKWHSAGRFPAPAISDAKISIFISNKIYGSNFIKQHPETVVVLNYQNADCSLGLITNYCHLLQFSAHPRSLWCNPERFCKTRTDDSLSAIYLSRLCC